MRESTQDLNPWSHVLAIIVLFPAGVYLDDIIGAVPGIAAFLAVFVPATLGSISVGRRQQVWACVVATSCLLLIPVLRTGIAYNLISVVQIGIASCAVLLTSHLTFVAHHGLVHELAESHERYQQTLSSLFASNRNDSSHRKSEPPATVRQMSVESDFDVPTIDPNGVNYPMLLLTIQDIGRRISTTLELEDLFETIAGTAKANLYCGRCSILLIGENPEQLRDAISGELHSNQFETTDGKRNPLQWVIKNQQFLTRESIDSNPELKSLFELDDLPDAIAPLLTGNKLVGVLVINDLQRRSKTFVRLLYVLANFSALAIRNAQLFKRIDHIARRDGMTGMLTHTAFHDELEAAVNRNRVSGLSATVVMGDIDHFKKFNDSYGHQAGDEVLKSVADLWRAVLPDSTLLGRYGGEEFIAILPEQDLERATAVCEILRTELEAYRVDFHGESLKVTSSFGVAELITEDQTATDLVRRLDKALYESKRLGRNQITVAEHSTPTN